MAFTIGDRVTVPNDKRTFYYRGEDCQGFVMLESIVGGKVIWIQKGLVEKANPSIPSGS
jgi:hypothetical protein